MNDNRLQITLQRLCTVHKHSALTLTEQMRSSARADRDLFKNGDQCKE